MRKIAIIFLVIFLWILAMRLVFTKFVARSAKPETGESTLDADSMLQQHRRKAQQTREQQKRLMEELKRKMRDQQMR